MRRAHKQTAVFHDGDNIALSFGFDFCSEHEWGIKGLHRTFGISNDADDATVQRYAVTRVPEGVLGLVEAAAKVPSWRRESGRPTKEQRLYLLGGSFSARGQTLEAYVLDQRESSPQRGEPEALWDERAFLFSVPADGDDAHRVREMHAAISAGDALMYCMGGGPFGGAGLVIVRRSTIPPSVVAEMEGGVIDAKRLREAAQAIGIRERVEAWGRERAGPNGFGCAFHALSPRWKPAEHEPASSYPVIFWLNPYDQQNNNYGWFTVEELEQWMQGRGPIPKRVAA